MITVNEDYKEAVKNQTREINAYVELLVDGRYIRNLEQYGGISSNDKAEITVLDTVVDDNSEFVNYASLENDYFVLDGSFILPNRTNNKHTGFIGDINSSILTISNIDYETTESERNKKNITIYFENGYATNFEVILEVDYGEEYLRPMIYNYTNNNKKIITTEPITDLVGFKNIKNIIIIVNSWSNSNHRVRIRQVNLGETILFEDRDIIEIDTTEQTDIYNLEVPNNDCSIKLNNYDRKFNVVDENNILNRLSDNSVMRIYYGIKVNGNYEYICMGNYNYNSYNDENNLYTVLNGVGNIESYTNQLAFLTDSGVNEVLKANTMLGMMMENSYYNNVKYNADVEMLYTDFNNRQEQLQAVAILCESYIKQTRINQFYNNKNTIIVDKLDNNVVDTVNLDIQIGYPKFKKINKIQKFKISNRYLGVLNENEDTIFEDIIQPEYNIENHKYQYLLNISSNSPIKKDTVKVYVNNNLLTNIDYIIEHFSYYTIEIWFVNLTNEQTNIKITAKTYKDEKQEYNIEYGNGELIEYNNNYIRSIKDKNRIAYNYKKQEKPYEFEFEMIFNPSLEIGDVILFENVDGYKKGIITTIDSKYNGGLTAIIKGVCENVL